MGLLSIFKRKSAQSPGAAEAAGKGEGKGAAKGASRSRPARASAAAAATSYVPSPDAAEAVREARARARRRLMGATVLLLAGVIGFPLLFETQPRPIPVDLPIDIPARNATAPADPLAQAGRRPGRAGGPTSSAVQPIGPAPGASVPAESVSYDARPSAAAPPAIAPAPAPASRTTAVPTHAEARPSSAVEVATAASRAYALLNPSASSAVATPALTAATAGGDAASDADRFVVQIGAFADDAKVRDARAKVEKLGLKTYTQSVDTPAGRRVRVRVGPYATRADADKAAGRIKADGLQAVVLVL